MGLLFLLSRRLLLVVNYSFSLGWAEYSHRAVRDAVDLVRIGVWYIMWLQLPEKDGTQETREAKGRDAAALLWARKQARHGEELEKKILW
jgi:hypothetical protein